MKKIFDKLLNKFITPELISGKNLIFFSLLSVTALVFAQINYLSKLDKSDRVLNETFLPETQKYQELPTIILNDSSSTKYFVDSIDKVNEHFEKPKMGSVPDSQFKSLHIRSPTESNSAITGTMLALEIKNILTYILTLLNGIFGLMLTWKKLFSKSTKTSKFPQT
jgi:hypothetical protein